MESLLLSAINSHRVGTWQFPVADNSARPRFSHAECPQPHLRAGAGRCTEGSVSNFPSVSSQLNIQIGHRGRKQWTSSSSSATFACRARFVCTAYKTERACSSCLGQTIEVSLLHQGATTCLSQRRRFWWFSSPQRTCSHCETNNQKTQTAGRPPISSSRQVTGRWQLCAEAPTTCHHP